MITKLVLTNFKKHENLTILFGRGMTALKGENERGKSSCYHAIVYAFFGARALPLTLAETVTYDKSETSLKVEMDFVFEGSTYKIVRSKSGAAISNGAVTANGQAEVTKFVEKLFGINADAATKLMIASQNGLRGALESGEAVPLIEKLANIDLIDNLVTKIQAQLPCGNTANIVSSVEELDKRQKPVLDLSDLEPSVSFHRGVVDLKVRDLEALKASDTIDEGYHLTMIARVVAAEQHKRQLEVSIEKANKALSDIPVKPVTDVAELVKLNEAAGKNRAKQEAHRWFRSLKQTDEYLVGDYDKLCADNKIALQVAQNASNEAKVGLARARAMLIAESVCGLCGKDLQDVLEVVEKNAKLQAEIAELQLTISAASDRVTQELYRQDSLNTYNTIARSVHVLHEKLKEHTNIDVSIFPPRLSWVGSEDLCDADTKDYSAELVKAEKAELSYQKAVAVRDSLSKQTEALAEDLRNVVVDHNARQLSQAELDMKKTIAAKISSKQEEVHVAKMALQEAEHGLNQAKATYSVELEHYNKSLASKKLLQDSLLAMQKNNALIRKLREVRPIVASRLWGIVLASVSTYFSQIRGEPTVITRNANSFLANGRAAAGLSGSTLDALGLAIRMALGKTFLPSVGFLLLDEPSAGMDDARETAMLGLLSAVAYDQVVVVTHSSLCDSFATAVVEL